MACGIFVYFFSIGMALGVFFQSEVIIVLCDKSVFKVFFFENLYANFYSSFAILYIPNTNFSTSFQKERESE